MLFSLGNSKYHSDMIEMLCQLTITSKELYCSKTRTLVSPAGPRVKPISLNIEPPNTTYVVYYNYRGASPLSLSTNFLATSAWGLNFQNMTLICSHAFFVQAVDEIDMHEFHLCMQFDCKWVLCTKCYDAMICDGHVQQVHVQGGLCKGKLGWYRSENLAHNLGIFIMQFKIM